MTLSIGDAAKDLGVSTKTLRRWADSGKIRSERSPSGQRRFFLADINAMCEEFETEVVIINKSSQELSFEQELVTDMIELITVFSALLYGSRSKKNKKLIEGMTQVVKDVS
ncbi:recombinase family protein [Aerosakkonema funiforme]|uniref:recombinase family protein n=1 Tax=Aerosakkonema funiforme TaxID=1246630 RepID=UPI0035B99CF8